VVEVDAVTVDGVRLSYSAYGAPDRPPMVLLHAFGRSRETWDEVATAFAPTHRVYALDLRGHGTSDWPGTYSFELMYRDVLGFLDIRRLGPIVLIGHSMGGTVSFLLAENHPERLAALVIEDTPPPRVGNEVRIRPRTGPVTCDPPLTPAIVGQLNSPDPAWWDRLGEISTPTLVIAGGPASHIPQQELAEVAELIPTCELVTIPVGHQVHEQRPAEFVAAVRSFLGT
jgi:pimeloyl-ACP methyl ester carboxylesterase